MIRFFIKIFVEYFRSKSRAKNPHAKHPTELLQVAQALQLSDIEFK
jgi:hypothetical protein